MRALRASTAEGRDVRVVAYSDATSVGGAEMVLGHLAAELDPAIDFAVVGVCEEVVEAVAARRAATLTRTVRPVRGKLDLRGIVAHVRAVRELRPDLLHIQLQSPWAGQYGILAGLLTRTPVVAVEQIAFGSTSELQRRLRRLLCRRLAAHVAPGDRAARHIEQLIGLSARSVEAIHNGVPDTDVGSLPRLRGGPVVGTVGRYSRQKGLDVLLRALMSLPEVSCVMVGDGPQRGELERLATTLGVADRIVMTGWVENPAVYLSGFDVFALPSRFEGLPLALIEAMLAELSTVVSDVDSVPEAVEDGRTGLIVEPDDPAALAAAIAELLDDPARRREMGARGRAQALAEFSSAAMARSYERLYDRVLGRGPG